MNFINAIKSSYTSHRLNKIRNLETSLNIEENLQASKSSPERLMPDKLKITLKTLPKQLSIASNMEKTVKSMKRNPKNPETHANKEFMEKFEKYAHELGVASVGYVDISSELVFKDRSLISGHAIVLTLEMDYETIKSSPSQNTQDMALKTYDDLGKITNKLSEYLRENGFAAQASHPAGGFVMYPWIAQNAGLGFSGRHGLLITPEFGPRQRISAIFTSISNLPLKKSDHSWMPNFCATCGKCIKLCPNKAILDSPFIHKDGRISCIESERCQGCTICIKECSFNKMDYYKIKELYLSN